MEPIEPEDKLPAIKMFISMLRRAVKPSGASERFDITETGLVFMGIDFARVWIQGIVVHSDQDNRSFVVDDGTATLTVGVPHDEQQLGQNGEEGEGALMPSLGVYVLLVGAVTACLERERSSCRRYRMLCDVMKDVGSESPNREKLWSLEVIDFWKRRERHARQDQ